MSRKILKKIFKFKSETEERAFWQKVDSTEYVDYATLKPASFPNLQLTTKPITIRLPQTLIYKLKVKAHQRDIPYQALLKQILWQGLKGV